MHPFSRTVALAAVLLASCGHVAAAQTAPYSLVDFHAHCIEATACPGEAVESLMDGKMWVATSSLQHYAIAATLGDPIPPGAELYADQNDTNRSTAERSEQVGFLASLECLSEVSASAPGWLAACLQDADQALSMGALGFKDHAGKTFPGSDPDTAIWVGAYNRLAGWCTPSPSSLSPNADCLSDPGFRFPLAQPEWRQLVRELVEVRGVPLLTHAVPWTLSPELCTNTLGALEACHDVAAEALLDFADWADANLTPEARRRIVVAHLGFLQTDFVRLGHVLDAGLSVDLAQPILANTGCTLRQFVADYPTQVVLGTDIEIGQACAENTYAAWSYALLGPAGVPQAFPNTCRGTMQTIGAGLGDSAPGACGIAVAADAGERVAWRNAAELLGLPTALIGVPALPVTGLAVLLVALVVSARLASFRGSPRRRS